MTKIPAQCRLSQTKNADSIITISELEMPRDQADAEFAAACQQLSQAQKAVHAARNRMKTAQRRYIDQLTERKAV